MRNEMKIGLIVGVLLAAGLIIYLVNQDNSSKVSAPEITLPVGGSQVSDEMNDGADAEFANVETPVVPAEPVDSTTQPAQPELPTVQVDATIDLTEPLEAVIPAVNEQPEPVTPVVEPEPVDTPSEPEIPATRYHTVKAGENLYRISEQYFGEGRFWKIILDANPDVITNSDVIQEGWKLRIPYPEEIADKP
ncbi:MAG: LysM peptidoglycan-binding domain-containing protein [Phycisphaerae bacterium]|nr:LysM peptidoglycan-binding domain-containing protein [Phycisphaerae bacterium]